MRRAITHILHACCWRRHQCLSLQGRATLLLELSVGPSHDEHETDERQLKKTSEEGKVAVRNVRRQVMQKIGRLARDGDISHDDQDRMADTIQELTDNYVDQIEDMIKDKRTRI